MPDFRRTSARLPGYDYAALGAYFVTICLAERIPRFGQIAPDGQIELTTSGEMVMGAWMDVANHFDDIALDAVILMPDHLHAIVFVGINPNSDRRTSLIDIVVWFKTVTTTRYGSGVRREGWPSFDRRLWQRSFYDRIIRNDVELRSYRAYIEGNPYRWLEKTGSLQ